MMKQHWKSFADWVNGTAPEREAAPLPELPTKREKPQRPKVDEARRVRVFSRIYRVFSLVVCLSVVGVLLYTLFHLPLFGAEDNPAVNEVVERYVEQGLSETGAVNMVTGMILDYRAFDTFGESSVLFLAVACVMMLLLKDQNNTGPADALQLQQERETEHEISDPILKRMVAVVFPCILLFGIYVVLNGHLSPGGGFSGGAVMGAGLILYSAAYGMDAVSRFFTHKTFRILTTTALLCYALSKAYSFFTGANDLSSGIPLGIPGAILSSGLILVLNICVGLIVACTMYGFYILFTKGEF